MLTQNPTDNQHLHRLLGAAFGIIFNESNEVLLCHRTDKDLWNLPGGGIEKHETPWDAAIREVREETGLEIVIDHFSGVYFRPDTNADHHDQLTFTFRCHPVGGQLTLNNEADQIKYFPVENLPANLAPRNAQRIQDALTKSQQTFFKELH